MAYRSLSGIHCHPLLVDECMLSVYSESTLPCYPSRIGFHLKSSNHGEEWFEILSIVVSITCRTWLPAIDKP